MAAQALLSTPICLMKTAAIFRSLKVILTMSDLQSYLRRILLASLLMIGALNCVYSIQSGIWSPRDEIAHYDYIERVGELSLPRPNDAIADHTFEISQDLSSRQPRSYDGTRRSMGLAGRSYEAQQPPLYYAILAVPNVLIRVLGINAEMRIRLLRIVGVLAQLAGALLFIPLVSRLTSLVGGSAVYGYLFALLALATNTHYYSTLGNDSFSLLSVNLTLMLLVSHLTMPRRYLVVACAFGACAAVWVKLTNLPVVIVPVVAALVSARRASARLLAWQHIALLAPLGGIPLLLLLNWRRLGGVVGSPEVAEWFGSFVLPVQSSAEFLKILAVDLVNVRHVWKVIPREYAVLLLALALCNLAWSLLELRAKKGPFAVVSLGSAVLTVLLFLSAGFLNHANLGVHWSASRHYFGMVPLVYGGIFGLHRLSERADRYFGSLLAAASVSYVVLLAWRIAGRAGF